MTGLELINNDLFNGYNTYPVLGGMYMGIIPEFINNALPVASQFGYNVSLPHRSGGLERTDRSVVHC